MEPKRSRIKLANSWKAMKKVQKKIFEQIHKIEIYVLFFKKYLKDFYVI